MSAVFQRHWPVIDYDLHATMESGQIFGWERRNDHWFGVVAGRSVELWSESGLRARVAGDPGDWRWLEHFLQVEVVLADVVRCFPPGDPHLAMAVQECRGLRLLRQDPWECLASFILSSTKQIVQIRQIVRQLRECYGSEIPGARGAIFARAFPTARQIASLSEAELRACKMGFRAPYLLRAACQVAAGEIDLGGVQKMELRAAQAELLRFHGVGEKIADCVLLFAYGFPTAFPVDVWVRRVLVERYFRGRQVRLNRLRNFVEKHFGPQAGYAQQYLFHHIRTKSGR